jgi:hypothetical protein
MARVSIRSTYALDVETVEALERMARRLRVSKSEALRRAIHAAAGEADAPSNKAMRALDELQRSLDLTAARAEAWSRRTRNERRSGSSRRETKSR